MNIHYLDIGKGVPLVLLHATAGSGSQWRGVCAKLVNRFRLIVPDLIGFGKTSRWPGPKELTQDDQADIVARLIERADAGAVHLAGHCYGGATAMRLASKRPDLVSSITLIEPMLNPLLKEAGEYNLFRYFLSFSRSFIELVSSGNEVAAWKSFLDLRGEAGRWDGLDERRKSSALALTPAVVDAFKSNLSNPTTLSDCREISVPTLIICSEGATAPERRVTEILRDEIRGSRYDIIPRAGHMSPCTHPAEVAQLIADHVLRNNVEDQTDSMSAEAGCDVR